MNYIYRTLRQIRPAPLAVFLHDALGIKRRVIETRYGRFYIDPVSDLGFRLTESGRYEPHMENILNAFLRPGGTFVDLGANEGYFSVLASRLIGPQGRVIAVEPQDRLIPIIEENRNLNGIANMTVVHAAIADSPGIETLHLVPGINTGATSILRRTKYAVPMQQTRTMTLGELFDLNNLRTVDLMKIDIEGYEYEAVIGGANVFAEHRIAALALEFHHRELPEGASPAKKIIDVLKSAGYGLSPQANNYSVWVVGGSEAATDELQTWLAGNGF